MADERSSSGDDAETDQAEGGSEPAAAGGLDVEAERGRLEDLSKEIEEGRRGLEDVEDDTRPDSDGPTIAAGDGAAIAPPG